MHNYFIFVLALILSVGCIPKGAYKNEGELYFDDSRTLPKAIELNINNALEDAVKAGEQITLSWTVSSTQPEFLKVEYSNNNGGIWITLSENLLNNGSYSTNAPLIEGEQNIIRIVSAKDLRYVVAKTRPFVIDNTPPVFFSTVVEVNNNELTTVALPLGSDNFSQTFKFTLVQGPTEGVVSEWPGTYTSAGFFKYTPNVNFEGSDFLSVQGEDEAGNLSAVFNIEIQVKNLGGISDFDAFSQSLHPILVANCNSCHKTGGFAGNISIHGSADAQESYAASLGSSATNHSYVDKNNPANSFFVLKIQASHYGVDTQVATDIQNAITSWNNLVTGN